MYVITGRENSDINEAYLLKKRLMISDGKFVANKRLVNFAKGNSCNIQTHGIEFSFH